MGHAMPPILISEIPKLRIAEVTPGPGWSSLQSDSFVGAESQSFYTLTVSLEVARTCKSWRQSLQQEHLLHDLQQAAIELAHKQYAEEQWSVQCCRMSWQTKVRQHSCSKMLLRFYKMVPGAEREARSSRSKSLQR